MAASTSSQQLLAPVTPQSVGTKFIWTIEKFSSRYLVPGERLKSTIIYTGHNHKEHWCLLMNPKGTREHDKNSVHLYLQLLQSLKPSIKVDVMFSIVVPGIAEATRNKKIVNRTFARRSKHGVKNIIKFSEISTFLKDDTLKVCCEIIPTPEPNNSPEVSLKKPNENIIGAYPLTLQDQLWMMFQNSENSDAIIIVEDKRFHVHKLILQVRSPVFAAMFEHKMRERSTNEIVIEDMQPEVVRKMLHFIYTDTIDDYGEIAGELLIAADRYALATLTVLCEQVLCSQLEISNAVATLILADTCNSKFLKSHVAEFINDNLPEIIETSDYKEMEKGYPELGFYLVRTLATRMIKN